MLKIPFGLFLLKYSSVSFYFHTLSRLLQTGVPAVPQLFQGSPSCLRDAFRCSSLRTLPFRECHQFDSVISTKILPITTVSIFSLDVVYNPSYSSQKKNFFQCSKGKTRILSTTCHPVDG